MATLTSIGVGGYKSIKDLQSLDLRPVTVLIGANGAGKSNLLAFFDLLSAIGERRLQEYVGKQGGAETLLRCGSKETPFLWASLWFTGKTGDGSYYVQLSAAAPDTLVFSPERVTYPFVRGSAQVGRELGSGHKESLLAEAGSHYLEIRELLADIRLFHFSDTSPSAAVRKAGYFEDNRNLHHDAGNLAAFLHGLSRREPKYYRRIIQTIRQIVPFFDDFDLTPQTLNERYILLNWRERDSHYLFGPHQLGDGTLRAMALTALLLQPENELPGLIVLDEPETGLHPYAIEILAGMIRGASVYRRLLVATQSPALVNCFKPEDVVVVTRRNSQSVFERQNAQSLSDWLADYTLGELWERNLIGGTPSR